MANSNIYFEEWLRATFLNDATLVGLLGKDTAGVPAIWPYHYQDPDERTPYPHLTIARFGDRTGSEKFQHLPFLALQMDAPRFALCAWSTKSVDEADAVYSRAQVLIQGPSAIAAASANFGAYQITRTLYRNDLYDPATKAYHVHAEYHVWLQKGLASIT